MLKTNLLCKCINVLYNKLQMDGDIVDVPKKFKMTDCRWQHVEGTMWGWPVTLIHMHIWSNLMFFLIVN